MTSNYTNAVELSSVTKTYGDHLAVDNLSITVPKGAIYGFIGPNGSGKTTTIRMILHILHADSGSIKVLGQTTTRAANDRIGYLPEERGLYKKMKVKEILNYYGALKGMKPRVIKAESQRLLETFDIADWSNKKIENLSKGMAQKIQFISTILSQPELVILDEPFSGLDPVNLEVIRRGILDLRDKGSTIIFSTHDMSMAEQMCDSVFMIHKGKKVLDGTLSQIKQDHGNDRIRIRTEGGAAVLENILGIESIVDSGSYQEVKLNRDHNAFLEDLLKATRVHHFEQRQPSLHDIFIEIANPQKEELSHV